MGDGRRFLKNTKLKEGDGTGNRQKMPKVDSSRDGSVSMRFGGGESAIGSSKDRRKDGPSPLGVGLGMAQDAAGPVWLFVSNLGAQFGA